LSRRGEGEIRLEGVVSMDHFGKVNMSREKRKFEINGKCEKNFQKRNLSEKLEYRKFDKSLERQCKI
jgi:hypothetical protein